MGIRLILLGLSAAGMLALQGCVEYGPVGRQDMDKVLDCRGKCIEERSRCGMDFNCDKLSQLCMDSCKEAGQKKKLRLSAPPGTSSDQ
ncbi:MAG: hypothetical protein NTY77_18990 [Elusimicrobia bacterium]|nr:hypothetical protein [Elusimicrobiota bacterium]